MDYLYTFSVWPSETWGFDRAVFQLFEVLAGRVEMQFRPEEFEAFRSALNRHGLTLREVERVRHEKPETVA
jgi:hypothetical protein